MPSQPDNADANVPSADQTNSDQWGGWGGSRARHDGLMNVLFIDGHVEAKNPDAIDPFVGDHCFNYWKPEIDSTGG